MYTVYIYVCKRNECIYVFDKHTHIYIYIYDLIYACMYVCMYVMYVSCVSM